MPDVSKRLHGITVAVTRPAHQAEAFCSLIEQAGGKALRFPVLEILDPEDGKALLELIDRLDTFDIAIFISPNAVNKALNFVHSRRRLPPTMQVAAIGRKSAKELERHGERVDIFPRQRFDSEALLEEPALQSVQGKRIVIFRGDGGREVLGDTLTARGAQVEYANAYRRGRPQTDNGPLMYHWSRGELHLIAVTSADSLRNLYDMVGKLGQMWLRTTPLVVGSERMLETSKELGFKTPPVVATDPSDESMLTAVLDWATARETGHG